jgi:hypothetical protein
MVMANYPLSDGEKEMASRGHDGLALGLDPVSPSRPGEIIDAHRDARGYSIDPQPEAVDMKRDRFSFLTWVMIVIAGVVLGVAMAMIAAG